ncbi:hypothetical protein PtrARCrB10_11984, partial [Pyrenophora tritici-repentis]
HLRTTIRLHYNHQRRSATQGRLAMRLPHRPQRLDCSPRPAPQTQKDLRRSTLHRNLHHDTVL